MRTIDRQYAEFCIKIGWLEQSIVQAEAILQGALAERDWRAVDRAVQYLATARADAERAAGDSSWPLEASRRVHPAG